MSSFIHKDIEFVLPGIFRADRRDRTDNFLTEGTVCFTNLACIRSCEQHERGDLNDGFGVTINNGIRSTSEYSNPIFVWCSTMETHPHTVMNTWQDKDTIIQFTDTLNFLERLRDAARPAGIIGPPMTGPVTYDKDEGSRRNEFWAQPAFQKNLRFSPQKEFRIALVGDETLSKCKNIFLEIKNPNDVARIYFPSAP